MDYYARLLRSSVSQSLPLPSYPVVRVQVKVLETEKAHLSQMLLQCKLLHSQEVQLMTEMHRQVTLSCD